MFLLENLLQKFTIKFVEEVTILVVVATAGIPRVKAFVYGSPGCQLVTQRLV